MFQFSKAECLNIYDVTSLTQIDSLLCSDLCLLWKQLDPNLFGRKLVQLSSFSLG